MKTLIGFLVIFISGLFLSACTISDQVRIDDKPIQPQQEISPTTTNLTPTLSDEQLFQDLGSDPDFQIDSLLNKLDSEL
jgi:hypothetical protein